MADVNLTVYTTPYTVQVPTGASAGVVSIGGLSGAVGLSGNNISISSVGNTLVFSGTPITSYVASYNGKTGDVQGVCAINGLTGVINYVARTNQGQTFSGTQYFLNGVTVAGSVYFDGYTAGIIVHNNGIGISGGLIYFDSSSSNRTVAIGNSYYQQVAGNSTIIMGLNNANNAEAFTNTIILGHGNFNSFSLPGLLTTVGIGNGIAPQSTNMNSSIMIGDGIYGIANTTRQDVVIGVAAFGGVDMNSNDNVCIGYNAGYIAGETASQNVIIGSQALYNTDAGIATTNNNVVIGYQALANLTTDLNNSVIIGPAYTTGINQSKDVTKNSNTALGDTQLMIGSGRTAWIAGSCAGYIGLAGITTPLAPVHIQGSQIILNNTSTPANASASGQKGTICWDSSYIYICVADNTWKRAAISTWP